MLTYIVWVCRDHQTRLGSQIQNVADNSQRIGNQFLSHVHENREWQECIIKAIRSDPRPSASLTKPASGNVDQNFVRRILGLLYFSDLTTRADSIPEAHKETFRWIFQPPKTKQRQWTDFTEWLSKESSLYWINGKAGAGKSTLMKYICDDARTYSHLTKWKSEDSLALAHFFFWNSGTQLQMSQKGLLRSLLYEILLKNKKLVASCFPERWEAYELFGVSLDDHIREIELQRGMCHMIEAWSSMKFCFFIDGLDEFEGDASALVKFINHLAAYPNVKLCVSSRPWPIFEDAFQNGPSLMLQDLTHPDLVKFVELSFRQNPGYAELEREEPKYAHDLIEDIATKASGVFLWVYLVVRSLLDGFTEGDRMSDLQTRLEALPPDLEGLFHKMLSDIGDYLSYASQLFQIIRACRAPLTLLALAFADEDESQFRLRGVRPLTGDEEDAKARRMRRRLSSRCKGLLEASNRSPANATVEYLHRTVREFLHRDDVWEKIIAAGPSTFNPKVALSRSYLYQLRYTRIIPSVDVGHTHDMIGSYPLQGSFLSIITWAIQYASDASEQTGDAQVEILEELGRTVEQVTAGQGTCTRKTCWCRGLADHVDGGFLALAVRLQMVAYVKARLSKIPPSGHRAGLRTLLETAVEDYRTFPLLEKRPACVHNKPSEDLVKILLLHGANPNLSSSSRSKTPWQIVSSGSSPPGEINWSADLVETFLRHGANPDLKLNHLRLLGPDYERVIELQKSLVHQGRKWYKLSKRK